MFAIDAHLDLATNAISLNRDLTKSVYDIRKKEQEIGIFDTKDRGNGTVALPELRKGNIGLVIATIIARFADIGKPLPSINLTGWHSPEQAFAFGQAQLAWYNAMEYKGEMVQINNLETLDNHLALWQNEQIPNTKKPIGYILSLEGADSIIDLNYLEKYHQQGLRAIGPAHFGPGRYAPGTHSDGTGLTKIGKELLKKMDGLNMILDATHLTDIGFFEAMDLYQGTVWASHQNCRALVPRERQFSDEQIKVIIAHDGVLGGALDTWMLNANPNIRSENSRETDINLEKLVDHFDHICQLAGNSYHCGFGSDLDGLFGTEQSPNDLNDISDISKFQFILKKRGYSLPDIENIFHGNWLRLIRNTWVKN
jgi:membrane dipeptidase